MIIFFTSTVALSSSLSSIAGITNFLCNHYYDFFLQAKNKKKHIDECFNAITSTIHCLGESGTETDPFDPQKDHGHSWPA